MRVDNLQFDAFAQFGMRVTSLSTFFYFRIKLIMLENRYFHANLPPLKITNI